MTTLSIRQSGGSSILSIPKVVLKVLNLKVGSSLNLSVENNCIVLTPTHHTLTLDDLLKGSPKACFKLNEEDREWFNMPAQGKEV
jgi:antitoxin ChpS